MVIPAAGPRPQRVEGLAVVVVAGDDDHVRAGVAQRRQRPRDDFSRRPAGARTRRGRPRRSPGRAARPRRRRRSRRGPRSCSSGRDCPLSDLPTCQSEVCRILTGALALAERDSSSAMPPPSPGDDRERVVGLRDRPQRRARRRARLGGPGGPGRERELDHQRHRDLGLDHEHRARLGDRGPLPVGGGQEPVLGPDASAGSSRPTTRIEELAMMRRSTSLAVCCAPIEDDAERPAALGDVEQDLLDRAECPPAARTC